MLLQHFMLNTDYDTLKEDSVVEKTLTISGSLSVPESKTVSTDIAVNPGEFFVLPSFRIDEVPNVCFVSARSGYTRLETTDDPQFSLSFGVVRKNATTYSFWARYQLWESSVQPRAFSYTIRLKLHLLLASTDE